MKQYFIWVGVILLFAGCTWVKSTETGSKVVLVGAHQIVSCTMIGSITTNVKHKVGFINRHEDKVQDELVTLAKNEAAGMGANAIVAKGPVNEGTMGFDAYSCGN